MRILLRTLKFLGLGVAGLILLAAALFGLAQTGPGKRVIASALGDALSGPGKTVTIEGVTGFIPFDIKLHKITLADAAGPWLTITDAAVAIASGDLLRKRLTLRHLLAGEIDVARQSAGGSAGGSGSLDLASLLEPPLIVTLDRLAISRLRLAPAVLGMPVTLAVSGAGTLGGNRAAAQLNIERTDGSPSHATLDLALGGTPLRLHLTADVAEPSGKILATLTGAAEPLPLAIRLTGDGALADWRGRLTATAGKTAGLDADFRITGGDGYHFTTTGAARVAALLPPPLRALAGPEVRLAAAVDFGKDDAIALKSLKLQAAAGEIDGAGRLDQTTGALAGQAVVAAPSLAALTPLAGVPLAGAGRLDLTLSGRVAAPGVVARLALSDAQLANLRIAHSEATLTLQPPAGANTVASPLALSGEGRLSGVALAAGPLPNGLGDAIAWRLDGTLDRQKERIELHHLSVEDQGATLDGTLAADLSGIAGEIEAHLADLRAFGGPAERGALTAEFHAVTGKDAAVVLAGDLRPLGGNDTRVDAQLSAQAQRGGDGKITGAYKLALPRLGAIDARLTGGLTIAGTVNGPIDAPAGTITLDGTALSEGSIRLDKLHAEATLADLLAKPKVKWSARFATRGIAGTAGGAATIDPGVALDATDFRLAAAGASLTGAARYDFARGTIDAELAGRVPDLRPWSALAGTALSGGGELTARLAGAKGQSLDLTLRVAKLGAGASTVQDLRIEARLADLFGAPSGHAEARVTGIEAGMLQISRLQLDAKSARPGRFQITATAAGKEARDKFTLTATSALAFLRGSVEATLTRFDGKLAGQTLQLQRSLQIVWRPGDASFRNLALAFGRGRLTGEGGLRNERLALHLVARTLPVAALARLAGQKTVSGALGFELTANGTRKAPAGRLVIDAEQLRLAPPGRTDLPPLNIVASADLKSGSVQFKGRVAGPDKAAIGFYGSAPLQIDGTTLTVRLPPAGPLRLKLEGDGNLAALTDLLPTGEDRLGGQFHIDVSVAGTIGAPTASGGISISHGSYNSVATGMALTDIGLSVVGNRDRLEVRNFTARDSGGGNLTVSGAVNLTATPGPALDIKVELHRLQALNIDEVQAKASGEVAVTGTLAAPQIRAQITVDQAAVNIPEQLPQSVQPVPAVIINSKTGQTLSSPDAGAAGLFAIALDARIKIPGPVFVRGRGLDSEWLGNLTVSGTTAAPVLVGKLQVTRGSFSFIGKTFTVTQGAITFTGGNQIDPDINIIGQIVSTNVTAIIRIHGTANHPQLDLSSQPLLPRDEILSRVLFGTSVTQVSPAEALQIAQAAAGLAGGGNLDVLGRLRRGLGLDRISLGSNNSALPGFGLPATSGQNGNATPFGNAAANASFGTAMNPAGGGATAGTSLTAGKYVAEGVYVGVSQGLTAGSSTVNVQIDVTRHISIDTQAGQASGTGLGIDWKLDY